jgi:hypothetical protein
MLPRNMNWIMYKDEDMIRNLIAQNGFWRLWWKNGREVCAVAI